MKGNEQEILKIAYLFINHPVKGNSRFEGLGRIRRIVSMDNPRIPTKSLVCLLILY
jgi:hypothetical protein